MRTYLMIKFADYYTMSDEQKANVNPDLLKRLEVFSDIQRDNKKIDRKINKGKSLDDLGLDELTRSDYLLSKNVNNPNIDPNIRQKSRQKLLASIASTGGSDANKTLTNMYVNSLSPSNITRENNSKRPLGKNYNKYERWANNDMFNTSQIMGDTDIGNLSADQYQKVLGGKAAINTMKHAPAHEKVWSDTLHTDMHPAEMREALMNKYIKEGYNPDQAFIAAEGEVRRMAHRSEGFESDKDVDAASIAKRKREQQAAAAKEQAAAQQEQQQAASQEQTAAPQEQSAAPQEQQQAASPKQNMSWGQMASIGAGATGGALLGGGLGYGASKGLGLYGEDASTTQRLLGHALTAGGAIGGGVLGGYGANKLYSRFAK